MNEEKLEKDLNENNKIEKEIKINIKNFYVKLIKHELEMASEKLDNQKIGVLLDEDLKELHEVYIKLRDIHF